MLFCRRTTKIQDKAHNNQMERAKELKANEQTIETMERLPKRNTLIASIWLRFDLISIVSWIFNVFECSRDGSIELLIAIKEKFRMRTFEACIVIDRGSRDMQEMEKSKFICRKRSFL